VHFKKRFGGADVEIKRNLRGRPRRKEGAISAWELVRAAYVMSVRHSRKRLEMWRLTPTLLLWIINGTDALGHELPASEVKKEYRRAGDVFNQQGAGQAIHIIDRSPDQPTRFVF
jgi:hypothetical protein